MIKDLVEKNRCYRRFYESERISTEDLRDLIELARLTSTGGNIQPMKYLISNTEEKNQKIFEELKWAAYLKDWQGPTEGERPSAYVIMLVDKSISSNVFWNHGLAAQSILLGAVEKGYGGCMFASYDKKKLVEKLNIPEDFDILMVIALGKPKEEVVMVPLEESGDIKYYRDENKVHYVPKRSLEELILDL